MRNRIAAGAVVAIVLALVAGTWVLLLGPDSVEQRGVCGDATWSVEVEPEDGGSEVGLEILAAGPGETWTIRAAADGEPLFDGERSSSDDGEVEVDLFAADADPEEIELLVSGPADEPCTVIDAI